MRTQTIATCLQSFSVNASLGFTQNACTPDFRAALIFGGLSSKKRISSFLILGSLVLFTCISFTCCQLTWVLETTTTISLWYHLLNVPIFRHWHFLFFVGFCRISVIWKSSNYVHLIHQVFCLFSGLFHIHAFLFIPHC